MTIPWNPLESPTEARAIGSLGPKPWTDGVASGSRAWDIWDCEFYNAWVMLENLAFVLMSSKYYSYNIL